MFGLEGHDDYGSGIDLYLFERHVFTIQSLVQVSLEFGDDQRGVHETLIGGHLAQMR